MRLLARPLAATAVLSVTLLTTAGCIWDAAPKSDAKAKDANELAADQPKAAQKPRPDSEPLFHATNATGGKFHEFDTAGGFTVRFACKGAGTATVSLNASAKYSYTCSSAAAEQDSEVTVKDPGPHTYRVSVSTSDAKSTWSIFLDRLRTR